MKSILQDLSFAELSREIVTFGEKKFRAAQVFGGLLSGKTYYYSETAKAGCWHYDDNGNAVPWEIA